MRYSLLVAFLIQLLSARLHHLIMRCFLDAAADEFLADIFFVVEAASRSAMTGRAGHFVALASFRRLRLRPLLPATCDASHASQLVLGLMPIGLGEFIRISLINHGDFSRPLLDRLGRWDSESIPMEIDFPVRRVRSIIHN